MQIVCAAFIGVVLIKIVSPVMMRNIKHMKTMLARNHLRIKYAPRTFFCHVVDIGRKRILLEEYGWYRNLHGGWTQGHMMDYIGPLEIARLNIPQLEYKLKHGSMAELPPDLSQSERRKYHK